ncbi:hypothetical protein H5410_034548, partial [Solanum commersonii]
VNFGAFGCGCGRSSKFCISERISLPSQGRNLSWVLLALLIGICCISSKEGFFNFHLGGVKFVLVALSLLPPCLLFFPLKSVRNSFLLVSDLSDNLYFGCPPYILLLNSGEIGFVLAMDFSGLQTSL